jgi:hypothetical protein
MSEPPTYNQDLEHLRLLRIFHFVYAGVTALFSCIPLIHVALGLVILFSPEIFGSPRSQPPRAFGLFFVFIGGMIILLGWSFAALVAWAGVNLGRFRRHTFCLVIACLCCLSIPFGTILGVFTIIVLNRPTVKVMFGKGSETPEARGT